MQNRLQPVRGRIIVRPAPKSKQSEGGILLPGRSDDEFESGTVVAVGPGIPQHGNIVPNCCSAGEEVLFIAGSGTPLKFDGETFLVIDDTDVVAHLQGEQNEVNES